jgi:hypothetical protein
MSHLTTQQLADLAGITKRQTQRVLDRGTPDLGASRTDGGHWVIPDTAAVRSWAKDHQRWRRGGLPKGNVNGAFGRAAFATLEGVATQFAMWRRHNAAHFDQWDKARLDRGIALLDQQVLAHAQLVALRDQLELRK